MLAGQVMTQSDVQMLLSRAAAASVREDAIIAVVDRGGEILGVRVEAQVPIADPNTKIFAIDGAVAKARTAAFFSSNESALTSRTVRFISQSTITQREVQSNPNIPISTDPNIERFRGPGFVAPIGVAGHFPPDVPNTPLVDLFGIEHTNRDGLLHPGSDGSRATPADNIPMTARFGIDPAFVSAGQAISAPESYGNESGLNPFTQSRGIATLPGGIPLYKNGELVGGIGVFFPGQFGLADYEQNFIPTALFAPGYGQTPAQRAAAPLVLQAEAMAFAAAGGTLDIRVNAFADLPAFPAYYIPWNLNQLRIDLVGVTLEVVGPGSVQQGASIINLQLIYSGTETGTLANAATQDQLVDPTGAGAFNQTYRTGTMVPEGWLVNAHPGVGITAAQVTQIVNQGIAQANVTRAAIRPIFPNQHFTKMVFSVTDSTGEVLGLYRMPDATVFSIDVAVAKARNVAYYDDAAKLQEFDRVVDQLGQPQTVPRGTAFTNRTFRFFAAPRYPTGSPQGTPAGAFSTLFPSFAATVGINPLTAENIGAPAPAGLFSTFSAPIYAFDAFNPGRNFRDPEIIYTLNPNQNGIVFFPGSSAMYVSGALKGGFGVSGDGVDQDDVVTAFGINGFAAPAAIRADQFFIRGVRLPYQKFNRNPQA